MTNRSAKKPAPFPSKEQVRTFIEESDRPIGKREIARAFGIKGAARIPLKRLMKELAQEGRLKRGGAAARKGGALPEVLVLQVIGSDADGDVWARPLDFPEDDAEPKILVLEERRTDRHLVPGDRLLARLRRAEDEDIYEARPIRRLEQREERVVGLLGKGARGDMRLTPTDKRLKTEFAIATRDLNGAREGEIVIAAILPARHLGTARAQVLERLGSIDRPQAISMVAIAEHRIPFVFASAVLEQAAAARPATLGGRTDLRMVPLVTIDSEDARDFDDAVFAEADADPKNPGGWRLVVAIADVAHYVRPDDALDRAARERGNSVYFPDRVVPMLPEALSNGWCSLKPDEDRPVLAVEIVIDALGRKRRHRFIRALMRSAARLTYERVEAALLGRPDAGMKPLLHAVVMPLAGAYRALLKAREARGTLDLDIEERRIFLHDGKVERIAPRPRLEAHKLIEEFMIAANVAAAESLERKRVPCMYRVHDQPDPVRIAALRQFLATLGLSLAKGQVLRPKHFTRLLAQASATPYAPMVNTLVLRAQSQAVYAPENIGHFGLALPRYAHFTSPIRRYADLLVHRALIAAYDLGEDGLPPKAVSTFAETGRHISATERRAAAAERESVDRYTAAFLAERTGESFAGRISGIARFGLFVRLEETGADGLVPLALLPQDFYRHDEAGHALIGRRSGQSYRLGDSIEVRLVRADPLTGGLTLEALSGRAAPAPGQGKPRPPSRPMTRRKPKARFKK